MCDSLQPHRLQHNRLHSPSITPGVYQTHVHWVSGAIQPSHPIVPFFFHPQSFLASGSFPVSLFFASGGQSIGVSASASVLPVNIQLISFRMDWLAFLPVQGTLKSLLQHHSSKASILQHSAFFIVQLSYPYMTTGKSIALTRRTLVGKVMSLLFNMLWTLCIFIIFHVLLTPLSHCLNHQNFVSF